MADFPVSEVSGAISHIVSAVVPPRAYTIMIGLLPGLFFEISILLANPAMFCELIARAKDGFGLGHYELLGVSLVLAFVIGTAFILLVTLIQRLLGYVYRLCAWIWEEFCRWPLCPLIVWLSGNLWLGRRQWFRDFSLSVQIRASGRPWDEGTRKLWAITARRLLKVKYGIEPQDLHQEEWNALYWTLGTLAITDVRGHMTMIVFEATGWCGLAAMLFGQELRNQYYLAFSVLLILAGLLHDWYVAAGLNNPQFLGSLRIRALLREFPHATGHKGQLRLQKSAELDTDSTPESDEL
jgi:hypothetical protein